MPIFGRHINGRALRELNNSKLLFLDRSNVHGPNRAAYNMTAEPNELRELLNSATLDKCAAFRCKRNKKMGRKNRRKQKSMKLIENHEDGSKIGSVSWIEERDPHKAGALRNNSEWSQH